MKQMWERGITDYSFLKFNGGWQPIELLYRHLWLTKAFFGKKFFFFLCGLVQNDQWPGSAPWPGGVDHWSRQLHEYVGVQKFIINWTVSIYSFQKHKACKPNFFFF